MPPLFGLIATHVSVRLFPVYLTALLALMVITHETLLRCCSVEDGTGAKFFL